MPKLFDNPNSTLWRKPKPTLLGRLGKASSASAADRAASLKSPMGFAMHKGLSFLAATIPFAGIVFDSVTLARIVQQFDPKFKLIHNEMSDDAIKSALLAHVKNKVLSENGWEQQQGMQMLRTMQTYAQRVSKQDQHPRSSEALRFVKKMQLAQKKTTAVIVKQKENARGVKMSEYLAQHHNAPAHLVNKYRRPLY
ncbi:hypothetical protein HY994_06315 [Candidatus Micrarchaeota archaeon]|nr:hypothetical protein [Candidatus Micrarchaeota archaeon]